MPLDFPQIAIAIGVLTSNRGEGDEPLWRIGRGTRVPLQGAVDVVPLLGAIVGCHCSVLWLRGRVTTNFGGVDVVPLLGAIVGCHWLSGVTMVPLQGAMVGGEGDDQLWGSGRGAIAGCHCRGHCRVLWLGEGDDQLWGTGDVVPLLGAIAGCPWLPPIFRASNGIQKNIQENNNEFCLFLQTLHWKFTIEVGVA